MGRSKYFLLIALIVRGIGTDGQVSWPITGMSSTSFIVQNCAEI